MEWSGALSEVRVSVVLKRLGAATRRHATWSGMSTKICRKNLWPFFFLSHQNLHAVGVFTPGFLIRRIWWFEPFVYVEVLVMLVYFLYMLDECGERAYRHALGESRWNQDIRLTGDLRKDLRGDGMMYIDVGRKASLLIVFAFALLNWIIPSIFIRLSRGLQEKWNTKNVARILHRVIILNFLYQLKNSGRWMLALNLFQNLISLILKSSKGFITEIAICKIHSPWLCIQ